MSSSARHRSPSGREDRETVALDEIAVRMRSKFPDVPTETVAGVIRRHYDEFAGSTIRDFIPVLVERAVRDDLDGRSGYRAMARTRP